MRCIHLLVLACLLASPLCAVAQENAVPSDPGQEQREAVLELRLILREVTENMRDKGMDPEEFRDQIRQGIQDGTFDMAELQKQLVEKGVMDQEMVESLRKSTRRLIAGTLRQQLGVTEEEWAVLAPKMQRVLVASAGAGEIGSVGGGPMSGMLLSGMAGGSVSRALSDLRATLRDPEAPEALITEKLAAFREAREKARAELKAAREDLRSLLTARQEAILANMGYL